jgi:hypothetical protein
MLKDIDFSEYMNIDESKAFYPLIKSIQLIYIAVKIKEYFPQYSDIFTTYVIDRLLRINQLYNIDKWNIECTQHEDYIEIERVRIQEIFAFTIEKQLKEFHALKTNKEKIHYLLQLEYGCLPEPLNKNKENIKDYQIVPIDGLQPLIYSNKYTPSKTYHFDMITKHAEDTSYYQNWKLPLGVCIHINPIICIIDGHSRFTENITHNDARIILGIE